MSNRKEPEFSTVEEIFRNYIPEYNIVHNNSTHPSIGLQLARDLAKDFQSDVSELVREATGTAQPRDSTA